MDIQLYLENHNLDIFGIIESDLHGPNSRVYRSQPLSTKAIYEVLAIKGYNIILPQSWFKFDQARVVLYVKEGIQVKEIQLNDADADLASISIQVGVGKERKSIFNIFYREFTGIASGQNNMEAQRNRLERQINHWKTLYSNDRDVHILGDSNLWFDDNSQFNEFSNMVQDFLLEKSSSQLVKESTRFQMVQGVIKQSTIDHCYSNVPEKVSGPFVESVGDSDHMGIRIIKYSKNKLPKPQVVKRRSFKSFNIADFLTDIYYSNINISVKSHEDIELASEAFRNEFSAILDLHAPIKTIQLRNNYCPYLYDESSGKVWVLAQ